MTSVISTYLPDQMHCSTSARVLGTLFMSYVNLHTKPTFDVSDSCYSVLIS